MTSQIYAANVHRGGAIVTTAAILNEMLEIRGGDPDLDVLVSSEVSAALKPQWLSSGVAKRVDDRPLTMAKRLPRRPKARDRLVFFGPEYRFGEAERTICGFADATALAPADTLAAVAARDTTSWWLAAIKRRLLYRYNEYVVQTESAAQRLRDLVGDKPIHVIPNCIHPAFLEPAIEPTFKLPPRSEGTLRMIYPAGPQPHKNHAVIDKVGLELDRLGIKFEVVTTVPPESELGLSLDASPYAVNVGRLSIADLIDAYRQCDAVFFPSLLETFSTVTIEARYMGLPVFASDRWFTREVAGDNPIYVEPLDPVALAQAIAQWISEGEPRPAAGGIDERHLPQRAAQDYLSLLNHPDSVVGR